MSYEPFVGEIKIFGFNFPPVGHLFCAGQLLQISQYNVLFALIGTTYGGNGQTTFALPDLQGRVPIGQGQGAGLPNYSLGQKGGSTSVSITNTNLPAHTHTLNNVSVKQQASTVTADERNASGNFPSNTGINIYSGSGATPNTFTGGAVVSGTTDMTGSNFPVEIMNPYLVINYSIAAEGIFPSRN